jgi:hypothetical protein
VMADKWANAKSNQKWVLKVIRNHGKYGLGPSRGLSGEARGPVWPQGSPMHKKGTKTMRNPTPFSALKWRPDPTFRGFFLKSFLKCSCFRFLMILGAQGPHFGFHFGSTLRAPGLWENSWKCCKGCQFQRFGPCQTESFYRSWLWVRFGDLFLQFFMIFSCLGTLILRAFGLNRGQKGGLKKIRKKGAKRGTRATRGKPWSDCGPLKEQENKTSEHQKTRKPKRWIKHALTYLKARWRIHY